MTVVPALPVIERGQAVAGGPVVLALEPDPIFATFHDAAAAAHLHTAVLICPPWGWDEVASYRARRAWAERLAATGYPTLRIDYPGTGDSAGSPSDPDRVRAWVRSIVASAAWLRDRPDVTRVAGIGLGLGALLLAQAGAEGAPIDDVVLWGSPSTGRAYLRELQAFALLEDTRLDATAASTPAGLPDGWREVGGFVMSAATVDDIRALSLAALRGTPIRRLLVLDRDGMGQDRDASRIFDARDAEVTTAPGNGWSQMVLHVERYAAPLLVFDKVEAWLAESESTASSAPSPAPPPTSEHMEIQLDGGCIRETAIRIDQPEGQLFGVMAQPVNRPVAPVCAIFLNAGAVRRIGPNRLWVAAARRWTARGVPTVRMDMEGIGDSDGDPTRYLDVGNFYTQAAGEQVRRILDDLDARGLGPRYVLIGLCAGGYWAFHTAAGDPRVITTLIVNPRAMVWDDGVLDRREARRVVRLFEPGLWGRVIRGKVPPSRMVEVSHAVVNTLRRAVAGLPGRTRAAIRRYQNENVVDRRFEALHRLGTRVVLAFSGNEPVYDELRASHVTDHLARWPNVTLMTLPGRDHTLRPIEAQQALLDFLDRELDLLLSSVGG